MGFLNQLQSKVRRWASGDDPSGDARYFRPKQKAFGKPRAEKKSQVNTTESSRNSWKATSVTSEIVPIAFEKSEIDNLATIARRHYCTVFKTIRKACYFLINRSQHGESIIDSESKVWNPSDSGEHVLEIEFEKTVVTKLKKIASGCGWTVSDIVHQACRNMVAFENRKASRNGVVTTRKEGVK